MAKFSRKPKRAFSQSQALITGLCEAIAVTKNSSEAAKLLTDLLGKQELEMLAVRLKVAELLVGGLSYDDIRKALKTSNSTIARVQEWLRQYGEGYRMVIGRQAPARKDVEQTFTPFSLRGIKKRYPMYFWPQLILENWVKKSSRKEKEEMRAVLSKLGNKQKLLNDLNLILKNNH